MHLKKSIAYIFFYKNSIAYRLLFLTETIHIILLQEKKIHIILEVFFFAKLNYKLKILYNI